MNSANAFLSPHKVPTPRTGRRTRAASAAAALAVLLGSVVLATPAAAQERPANLTRSGPNLTLVVANCQRSADIAIAQDLARYSRKAAAACLDPDGVPAETAKLITEFAPDGLMIVGGHDVIPAEVMDTVKALARSTYRWTVMYDLGGTTRVETAAAAARIRLGSPKHVEADTVTFVVADGWNDDDVNTALEFVGTIDDAALLYFHPNEVSNGLSQATTSLIADYRPARIIFAGLADEVGLAAEAAIEAALEEMGSDVYIERVAVATGPPSPAADTSTLTRAAREKFEDIVHRRHTPHSVSSGAPRPFLALTEASGVPGVGSSLFTLRADGSGRELRTVDHNGWEWHPSGDRLAWSDNDERVMVAAPDAEGELLAEQGIWPLWSPDGSRLVVFDTEDLNDDGWTDRATAFLSNADGTQRRSLGYVDVRTWYYADIDGGMWSPDGAYLAYATGDIDPETMETVSEARIERADGSAPAVSLAGNAIVLRWSPDSSHLLYATPNDCDGDDKDDSWNLHVVAADGSGAREIGPIDFNAWDVLIINPWSPDSKHVAYRAMDPQDCSTDLYVSAVGSESDTAADAEPVHIVADAKFLGWSPASAYIEFGVETDLPVTDYLLPEQSWLAHRDGSSKRYIGELSPSAYGWIFWSEDGAHISYSEIVRDADGNQAGLLARTQRADGTGDVTTLAQLGNSLSWSADGRAAYVALHDDDGDGIPDREALYVHTPGSPDDDVQLVHALPAPTRVVIWSPDSSHLIYASGSIESLIGWFRDRGRGVNVWGISTSEPRWMHRLITDVTWGEWQPQGEAEADAE